MNEWIKRIKRRITISYLDEIEEKLDQMSSDTKISDKKALKFQERQKTFLSAMIYLMRDEKEGVIKY